jgi:hypothetical protein
MDSELRQMRSRLRWDHLRLKWLPPQNLYRITLVYFETWKTYNQERGRSALRKCSTDTRLIKNQRDGCEELRVDTSVERRQAEQHLRFWRTETDSIYDVITITLMEMLFMEESHT